MSRKNRPYYFYDTTSSLCSSCLRLVEAKIIFKDGKVYMDKWCPTHGSERVLMNDDVDFYRLGREVFVKQPEMPHRFNSEMRYGCPYDCGLCPDHMQHSCLSIVEINNACNLNCPVCFAESGTHKQDHYPLAQVEAMLDAVLANEHEPDVVQLSGGEPTLYPQFFEILAAARARPVKHLMINTNGIRIAREDEFVARLLENGTQGLEIYLQFDTLRPEVSQRLRGADLISLHERALDKLDAAGLSTTLVMTVAAGVNDDELGEVIRYATTRACVRGVTVQPLQFAGRTEGMQEVHRLTVGGIRRRIVEQSEWFTFDDILPVPCNPDTLAMAYAFKDEKGDITPLTRHIEPCALVEAAGNTIVFEHDQGLKEKVFTLFSTHHSPESQAACLNDLMCCLPQVAAPQGLGYENVFRLLIVQFMDKRNLDIRALKKSCIHFATPQGQLIPFETYNLFHRDGLQDKLTDLRSRIVQAQNRWDAS